MIKVSYLLWLREVVGDSEDKVFINNDSTLLRDLLSMLTSRRPVLKKYIIIDSEDNVVVSEHVIVLINNMPPKSMDDIVYDGDHILIIPQVSGG